MTQVTDWKYAFLALERDVMRHVGVMGGFVDGLADHSPQASRRMDQRLGVLVDDVIACRKNHRLPEGLYAVVEPEAEPDGLKSGKNYLLCLQL